MLLTLSLFWTCLIGLGSGQGLSALRDLQTLRVTGVLFKPFLNRDETGELMGVDFDILSLLAKHYNFTFTFEKTNAWGKPFNQTTWIGTVGNVYHGVSDLGIGAMMMDTNRFRVIDYTSFIMELQTNLYTRKPIPLPAHLNVTKPFPTILWLVVFLIMVLMWILLPILETLSTGTAMGFGSTFTALWLEQLGSFLGQARPYVSDLSLISKTVFRCSWCFYVSLILMAYESNLRANLISVDFEQPVDGPEDVIRLHRVVYLPRNSVNSLYFKTSPFSILQDIYKEVEDNGRFFDYSGDLPPNVDEAMIREGVVIPIPSVTALSRIDNMRSTYGYLPFRLGREVLFRAYTGFVTAKGSALTSPLSEAITRLNDGGILQRIVADNLPSNADLFDEPEDNGIITLDQLLAAVTLWIFGITLSIIIFGFEFKKMSCKKQTNNQDQIVN